MNMNKNYIKHYT